jgi:hypothetical protein
MENTTKPQLLKATLNWGLILGAASIAFTVILYIAGLITNKPASYVGILISIIVLYFGIKAYRDQYLGGVMSYGQALGAGVLISLFGTIISIFFTLILFVVIDPGLIDMALQDSADQMMQRGMDDSQIEQGLSIAKKMFVPMMVIFGTLSGVFFGFLISLVHGAILKKDVNPFDKEKVIE